MLLKTQAKYVCGFSIWVLRCRTQRSYGDVAPLLLSLMLVEVALKLFRPMPVVIKTEFEDVAVVAVSAVALAGAGASRSIGILLPLHAAAWCPASSSL